MGKIGFLGCGKMATALVGAVLRSEVYKPEDVLCSDADEGQRAKIEETYGVGVTASNAEVVERSEMVVLAFKPQNFLDATAGLAGVVRRDQVIVSILAGVRIARIEDALPGRVVRVMPNAACLVGQMAAGYATSGEVTAEDKANVEKMLSSCGLAVEVSEEQLDAVTGLSGSGPAFAAYVMEQFMKAGTEAGLSESVARDLVLQTFLGTVNVLKEWKMEPKELIEMVTSPAGTTAAGREVLERSDISEVIRSTVQRATERSRELG
ncbi:MAG: pyrroline-5-carboxylate reductase [Planctomycetes bacterium]|nr:pyrroline-5-carboxylate reductase [Planctomycetota bacterium]